MLSLSVPILVRRVRNQNISDKLESIETGEFHNGDAAFADYPDSVHTKPVSSASVWDRYRGLSVSSALRGPA